MAYEEMAGLSRLGCDVSGYERESGRSVNTWKVDESGDVITPSGRIMAPGESSQEIKANAYLIAAAPDLLLACKMAYNLEPEHMPEILDALRAAIAKAEGRQP